LGRANGVLLNNYASCRIGRDIWQFCVLLCGMFVREKPIGPYRYIYLVDPSSTVWAGQAS
jgi:hypothetical protein